MWRTAVLLPMLLFVPWFSAAQEAACSQQGLAPTPPTIVQSVRVEGGREVTDAAVAAANAALKGPYRHCELNAALHDAAELIMREYQIRGYYKASIGDPITRPAGADKVDVTFVVTPGAVYSVAQISFTNAAAFPPAQLRALFKLQTGEVFNALKFAKGLESMRQLYTGNGYINCTPVPQPEFNDESKTIAWTIDVDEGAAFTFGALVLDGPEPAPGVGKRLIADWQPLIGKIYNPELFKSFIQEHAKLLGVNTPSPEDMFQVRPDQQEHVLTVILNFPD